MRFDLHLCCANLKSCIENALNLVKSFELRVESSAGF